MESVVEEMETAATTPTKAGSRQEEARRVLELERQEIGEGDALFLVAHR